MNDERPLKRLANLGQACWLDDLSRPMLDGGELERLVREDGLRGVTSNPAIFHAAIAGSDAYDAQLREGMARGRNAAGLYEDLTTTDVRRACDVLRPVYEESQGADGFVSLEVSPHLARATRASITEARHLAGVVGRPNLMIKIPGTVEGLPAIEELLWEGINVNVTLLFSVARYEAVVRAWLQALERRVAAGRGVRDVASVASFFLSRIDVLVDALLEQRVLPDGTSEADPHPGTLRGQAAIASAHGAYAKLRRVLAGERWKSLAAAGAQPQRLLWASTGTKNPAYSDVMYVEPLIGPCTVSTMPRKTLDAFTRHGRVANTLRRGGRKAAETLRNLRRIGIDMRQVAARLEDEGVRKFIEPYDGLLDAIERKRREWAQPAGITTRIEDMAHEGATSTPDPAPS